MSVQYGWNYASSWMGMVDSGGASPIGAPQPECPSVAVYTVGTVLGDRESEASSGSHNVGIFSLPRLNDMRFLLTPHK